MAIPATLDWQIYDAAGCRKYLNREETNRFLEVAGRYAPPQRALCYLLAFTGCRISEALALKRHQLDVEQGRVSFRTLKRRKTVFRAVPVPPDVMEMLRALPTGEDGIFFTLSRSTAWRWIAAAMEAAEVNGPMASPKGLRHAFGIRAAMARTPPGLTQRWMGHASLRMTTVYTDAVGTEERYFAERIWTGLRLPARATPSHRQPVVRSRHGAAAISATINCG